MKGTIKNNQERDKLIEIIQSTDINRVYRYEWTKKQIKKTLNQNAYVWLVLTYIQEETGNMKDDLYHFCLDKFPIFEKMEFKNEVRLSRISLSRFSKEQTSKFIDNMVVFFRQEGFDVPDPDDQKAIDMFNYYQERGLL